MVGVKIISGSFLYGYANDVSVNIHGTSYLKKQGGSVKETAEVLRVSSETVMRDWRLAKAWLLGELKG